MCIKLILGLDLISVISLYLCPVGQFKFLV